MSKEKYKGKGLLVIGGGILQQQTFEICNQLGIVTYLVDNDENCFCMAYTDHFRQIDIRDTKNLLNYAESLKDKSLIHGVFTQGTDVEHVVAYLSRELGFNGTSFEAADICNDKSKCREVLYSSGIDLTPYFIFDSELELKEKLNSITDDFFPCYVKPINNSGSRGVLKVQKKDELLEAFYIASGQSYHSTKVLIEKEIVGEEISVDSIVIDKVLYPCGISDRSFLVKDKYAIQTGSITPSSLPIKVQTAVYELMQNAANAIGMDNGAFKGDLVIRPDNSVGVIELAGRTSGGFDSQYRKPLSFGINIIKSVIDISLGVELDFRDIIPKWVKYTSTYSVMTEPGVIESINGFNDCLNIDGVKHGFMVLGVGDVIEEMTDCAKRFNYFICMSEDLSGLKVIEQNISNTLKIKLKE